MVLGFDFNFVTMDDELGTETKQFPLQGQVDVFDGLSCLLFHCAMRDLISVELEVNAADGDDFNLMQGEFSTR